MIFTSLGYLYDFVTTTVFQSFFHMASSVPFDQFFSIIDYCTTIICQSMGVGPAQNKKRIARTYWIQGRFKNFATQTTPQA